VRGSPDGQPQRLNFHHWRRSVWRVVTGGCPRGGVPQCNLAAILRVTASTAPPGG